MLRHASLALVVFATVRGAVAAAGGDLLWSDRIAGAGNVAIAAATSRGRAVAGGWVTDATGNRDWLVRAYDAGSGTPAWEDRLDVGGVDAVLTLAAAGARVFGGGFVADTPTRALVRAYDAGSGRLLWEDSPAAAAGGAAVDAVATNGRYTVAVGSVTTAPALGDTDIVVRTYDAATGRVLWSDRVDEAGFGDDAHAVAVHGDLAVVAGSVETATHARLGVVRAYDLRTGVLRWEDRQGDPAGGAASVDAVLYTRGTFVAAGATYTEAALGDDDGRGTTFARFFRPSGPPAAETLWPAAAGRTLLAASGTRLYVLTHERDATGAMLVLRAVDLRDGAVAWEARYAAAGGFATANGLAVAAGRVVAFGGRSVAPPAAGIDQLVWAVNARDGSAAWERSAGDAGDDYASAGAARGNRLFVAGNLQAALGAGSDWSLRAYRIR